MIAILRISIIYFIEIKDLEQASIRYELLEEIAPDEDVTLYCQERLSFARLKQLPEERSTYSIQTKPQPTTTKTEAPKFTHSQVNILYHQTVLNQSQIESLLALPRETLIQDLETILKDNIERYSFFEKNKGPEESNFLIHALFLLQELKAKESLDQVLEIFKQSTEYLDLYLMDFLTEYGWQIIFTLAVNRLELDLKKKIYLYLLL